MDFPSLHQQANRRPGFTLIATFAFLALLAVIGLGLAGLGSSAARFKSKGAQENEAQANARLALMLAIAELQTFLGPDQRVSAPAGIFDRNPDTLPIDGVAEPHWTAVWSTEIDRRSPWERDDLEGGLSDRRTDTVWDREEEVLSFLVSGNEGGRMNEQIIDNLDTELGAEAVRLVGDGSVTDPSQHVKAPRVSTKGGGKTGAYAFWVGDLGVKANVAVSDQHGHQTPTPGKEPDGMPRMANAQDVEAGMIEGMHKLDKGEAQRLVTRRTLELTRKNHHAGVKQGFHDMTIWSKSVLSDTRDGGMQRDLTAYLHSNGTTRDLESGDVVYALGVDDDDNLIGPANLASASSQGVRWERARYTRISPKFSMLRRWNEIGMQTPWDAGEVDAISPSPITDPSLLSGLNDGVNVYDGSNLRPASFVPLDRPTLSPVMVEGSLFYNLATYPDSPSPNTQWNLRICLYPRIALWNPFDVALRLPPMAASIFVNGNKDVQLRLSSGQIVNRPIPFGRGSTKVGAELRPGELDASPAHYVGWMIFHLDPVTMAPGETLVFSPEQRKAYDIEQVRRNVLSPTTAPDPSLYFWQDMQETIRPAPVNYFESPGPGVQSGPDHNLMMLKDASSVAGRTTDSSFNSLQTIVYANCSLQAGSGDELPIHWNPNQMAPVHRLVNSNAGLPGNAIPDTRTRDGFRLRWWEETRSNIQGSGRLNNSPQHLQSSLIGTWNPRAAYFCRTPWDNVTDVPPYFYGMYTRDLFDQDVSWNAMTPRARNGKMTGNPIGPPVEGPDGIVLFEVPRAETGIPSLGYLRHLKLSEFGWAPSYAAGNSLVDPRVGRLHTSPAPQSSRDRIQGGWNQYTFGWATGRGGRGPDDWALTHRQILFNQPPAQNVTHDLSFELNHTLWDGFFLSTGGPGQKRAFLKSGGRTPLPNGRMKLRASAGISEEDLNDVHRAATRLMLEGGFNVHSTSKEAWKAVLSSTMDTGYSREGVPFPRVLNPPEGEWLNGQADDDEAVAGFRTLAKEEIDDLAEEIVREVKERAPFLGLSDFINRRLEDSEHGDKGPIEAAISAAGLNAPWDSEYPLRNDRDLPNVSFDNMVDSTRLDQTLKPDSVAWGIPGYLTQGDVVQVIGSSLRPRSDTFVIRAYGESVDTKGTVTGRAWCEAIVQRSPEPLDPDPTGVNPEPTDQFEPELGRRFEIVSFRWLSPDEV